MATPEADTTAPKAFISYSWDDDAHKEWVRQLATRLRKDGVDVTLDRWHSAPGDKIPAFMERAVRENDFVIAVCTPRFKERSDEREGGVGYEGDIMTAYVFTGGNKKKFIPVLRRGNWDQVAPDWLRGRAYIDLSKNSESAYEELLRTLHSAREEAPPIGPRPDFRDKKRVHRAPPRGGVETFFTNVNYLMDRLKKLVVAPQLGKRLFVIQGEGGAGKSAALLMLGRLCAERDVAFAQVASDAVVVPSMIEVLRGLEDSLKAVEVELPDFRWLLGQYDEVQDKIPWEQRQQERKDLGRVGIDATLPWAGPTAGVVAKMAGGLAEPIANSRQKCDPGIIHQPEETLTAAFARNVNAAAEHRRLVLAVDVYERILALDQSVCGLVHDLGPNVLVVIAGRATPGEVWERCWPGWLTVSQVVTMKPLSDENVALVIRKYGDRCGLRDADPAQVEKIIRFAQGLPLAVISSLNFWVTTGQAEFDFDEFKLDVVQRLAARILNDVPDPLRQVVQAAAVVHWFDKDVLAHLTDPDTADQCFNDLRRLFESNLCRREGRLSLHDRMRENINDFMKDYSPDLFETLNRKAAAYFKRELSRLAETSPHDQAGRQRYNREVLYHTFQFSESEGMDRFRKTFEEEFFNRRQFGHCQTLLKETGSHPLSPSSRMLLRYYEGLVAHYAAKGFDLRLMSSLNDVSGIPTEGKDLIIVVAVNKVLHFRIFDGDGKVVVDTDEQMLTTQAQQIGDLRKQLESLWPPHELTRSDKDQVTKAVTSIVGHTPAKDIEQPRKILEGLLDEPGLDTALRIRVLEYLAGLYWYFSLSEEDGTRKANQLYRDCLALCEDSDDCVGQTRILIWQGILLQRTEGQGEPSFRKALKSCDQHGDDFRGLKAWIERELSISLRMRGSFDQSAKMILSSIRGFHALDLPFEEAHSMVNHGMLLVFQGKLRKAERRFKDCIRLFETGDESRSYEKAWPVHGLGDVAMRRGRYEDALSHFKDLAEIWKKDHFGTAVALSSRAEVRLRQGFPEEAVSLADQALARMSLVNDKFGVGWTLRTKGLALAALDRTPEARKCLLEGLELMKEYNSCYGEALLTLGLYSVYLKAGDDPGFEEAAAVVNRLGTEHGFHDFLAELHVLQGRRFLSDGERGGAGVGDEPVAVEFGRALVLGLRHNIFLLDRVVQDILQALQPTDPDRRARVVRGVLAHWGEAEIDGKSAMALERDERDLENSSGHATPVAERLASGVPGGA